MATTIEELAQRQIAADLEHKKQHRGDIALTAGGIGLGLLGIGTIGLGLWAGWTVAGVIAFKLGLLGFWWHLLSMAIVGSAVMIPFLAVARLMSRGAQALLNG